MMSPLTMFRYLRRSRKAMAPAVALMLGLAAPTAVASHPWEAVGLQAPYTFSNCSSKNVEENGKDPINVVFKGGNPKGLPVDHTLAKHGWNHDDYTDPIVKWAEFFHIGHVDQQYIYNRFRGCKHERDQAATGNVASSRDHVRLFESVVISSTGAEKWNVVGDAHHDQLDNSEPCEIAPFIPGHYSSEFTEAREDLAEAWPAGVGTVAKWGNTAEFAQCKEHYFVGNSDGKVRVLNGVVAKGSGVEPENTEPPVISGSGVPGQALTVSSGTWEPPTATFTYQWCYIEPEPDECRPISGAVTNSWTPQPSDEGKVVAVTVQPVGAEATDAVLSNAVGIIPVAPSAQTEGAQNVQYTTAEVTGTVNPHGGETHYDFEYGETRGYGKVVPAPEGNAGSGTTDVHVVAAIEGLSPGTVYHYRLVARNGAGTTDGEDASFKTRGWKIQPTINPKGGSVEGARLIGVSCWSNAACTSVGDYYDLATEYKTSTLVEYWPGTAWELQASPNPVPYEAAALESASCLTSSECTATGYYEEHVGQFRYSLGERWNGSSWATQTTPSEGHESNLVSVSCASSTECVAGGYYVVSGPPAKDYLLTEVWNGIEWKIVAGAKLPETDEAPEFSGVSCSGAKSCLAVGSVEEGLEGIRSLAERWNGTSWENISPPRPPHSIEDALEGVSCSSSTSCTAVGHLHNTEVKGGEEFPAGEEALVERWDGASWTVEQAANPEGKSKDEGGSFWRLSKISCALKTACVAVGTYASNRKTTNTPLLGEYWDGSTWSVELPTNRSGAEYNTLTGVSCSAAKTCTAVGYSKTAGKDETLAERLE
jgi:hypothetical protein